MTIRKAQAQAQPQLRGLDVSEVQALLDEYQRFAVHAQQLGDNRVAMAWHQAAQRLQETAEAPAPKTEKRATTEWDDTISQLTKMAEGRRF